MPEDGAELLEELMRFRPEGMTANAWAVRAGVSRTIWADLRRHGNPSRRTLSKLLEAAGSSLAEFEALRVGSAPPAAVLSGQLAETGRSWRAAPLAPLPLKCAEPAGIWARDIELIRIDCDRAVDRLPRPESLASDSHAYAITVVGESMWPRFRQGRRLAVSPSSPVVAGDDVLVFLAGGEGALIGELLRQSAEGLRLRQFSPAAEFQLSANEVAQIHKVVGELI